MQQQNTALNSGLAETVKRTLQDYLDTLGDHEATNIYRLIMDEVERPLLEVMLNYTHGNQCKAAQCMGINRATLRTKLKRFNLI